MIVFDNIVFNLQLSGGISRLWSELIQQANSLDQVQFIEHGNQSANIYRKNLKLSPILNDHKFPLWISRYLGFYRCFHSQPYIFHSSYFRINKDPNCINVTTVHDLIYEKFGHGFGSFVHLKQKKYALEHSDCIVCVSMYTKNDLLRYYPFCRERKIIVIPNGVKAIKATPDELTELNQDIPSLYFLYVGHRGECKSFHLVCDVLDMKSDIKCVVVGAPFDANELKMLSDRKVTDRIINMGRVSEAQLKFLYSSASFFFFPSLYEGFGIPPLEAMIEGCPVLASNCSSIPEVVGNAGVLFDPTDPMSLKGALSMISDPNVRSNIISLGIDRASELSWENSVNAYYQLYKNLLEEKVNG